MWNRALGVVVAAIVACGVWSSAPQAAASAPYTQLILHVNAGTTITLTLVQNAGACTLTGSGTNAAAIDLGTGDAFAGTSCSTFTPATNYKFTTSFSYQATCVGRCGTKYQLSAALASTVAGVTYKYGGVALTTTPQNVGSAVKYSKAASKNFIVTVSSAPPPSSGTVADTIDFTATDTTTSSTATATLAVSFVNQAALAIYFIQNGSGVAFTSGNNTSAAALDFGNVSAYGTLPAGVTQTSLTPTQYTLRTFFNAKVKSSGTSSANYDMQAALASAAPTGLTYAVQSVTLTTSPQTVRSAANYGTSYKYTLDLIVLSAAAPTGPTTGTPLAETLDFTASAN